MKSKYEDDEYFDRLLREALLEAARRDYKELPSDEALSEECTPSDESTGEEA